MFSFLPIYINTSWYLLKTSPVVYHQFRKHKSSYHWYKGLPLCLIWLWDAIKSMSLYFILLLVCWMEMSLVFIVYSLLVVKVLVFCITNASNQTVSSNKINVPVLNGSVSGVHCLLHIIFLIWLWALIKSMSLCFILLLIC